jgi:hypothetical protein
MRCAPSVFHGALALATPLWGSFMQAAQEEMIERQEVEFRRRDRQQRAAELNMPGALTKVIPSSNRYKMSSLLWMAAVCPHFGRGI